MQCIAFWAKVAILVVFLLVNILLGPAGAENVESADYQPLVGQGVTPQIQHLKTWQHCQSVFIKSVKVSVINADVSVSSGQI